MSVTFRLWRERWAARRMIVTRWIAQPRDRVAYDQPICELEELQMLSLSARHWAEDARELLGIVRDVIRASPGG